MTEWRESKGFTFASHQVRRLSAPFFPRLRTHVRTPAESVAALLALQLHPRHLTGAPLRVLNKSSPKNSCEDFRATKKILCYYAARSALKFSFTNCNRARHFRRIPRSEERR